MTVQQTIKKTNNGIIRNIAAVVCIIFCFLPLSEILAQENILNRVSAVERSDGKGFVVRYHLSEKVDSFRVFQPTPDLVQMTLYSQNIDTADVSLAEENDYYDEIRFYDIPHGVGVDVYLSKNQPYLADSYPDGSSDDLLLALTKTSEEELKFLTEGLEPVLWSMLSSDADSMVVQQEETNESGSSLVDDSYKKVKDKMKFDVVVIDAGHGGHDVGAIGYKGVYEKDIALKIAKKVGNYIEKSPEMKGVKVVYTREDDRLAGADANPNINAEESLFERGKIANKAEGDLFVSIHANKFHSRQPNGTEVYFLGLERSETALEVMKRENNIINGDEEYDPDKVLSPEELLTYELQNSGYIATSEQLAAMIDHQFENRAQRRSRGVKQARFVVLHQASMPAILVETGFISNPSEQRFLTSDWGQSIIASAIYRAIRNFKVSHEKSQTYNNTK